MILIGGHRTEMRKFFIFTPASPHRSLRVSQSAPASPLSSSAVTPETVPFRLVVSSPQGVPPTAWKTRRRQSHRSSSSPPPCGKRAAAGLIGAPAARPWPRARGRGTPQHRRPPTPPAVPPSSCVITSRLDHRRPRLSWSS